MIPPLSRRTLLRGTLVAGAGAVVGYVAAAASGAAGGRSEGTAANSYGYSRGTGGRRLADASAVPRGGGIIVGRVVLTRGSDGTLHAFSSTCTHQGCTVSNVTGNVIDCPCHGSRFDARTGAVVRGPAARALPPVAVVERNGGVYAS